MMFDDMWRRLPDSLLAASSFRRDIREWRSVKIARIDSFTGLSDFCVKVYEEMVNNGSEKRWFS